MTLHYQDDTVTLYAGDCLDVLRGLPDASVDSVVTDPPYSLSFMNRSWDAHESPAEFQAWCELWATECLRVLKPGGFIAAFGGTRTSHRLACAIEDAGFEVRDSIAWLYGCLSDDTEILSDDGWVRYDRASESQRALAFDPNTGALEWQQIQHVHRYWHDGEMVRLHSDDTDQLLTPNHRVVVEAGTTQAQVPYVPSHEDLLRLLGDVRGPRPLPVGASVDVLEAVREPAGVRGEEGQDDPARAAQGPDGAVRGVRDGDVEAGRMVEADRGGVLLLPVQRGSAWRGVEEARAQGQRGANAGELRGGGVEDDRREQPRVEGRRYRVQEARELCRRAVRAGAGMGAADGPEGRVHHGAPAADGGPVRVPVDADRGHQPREPRPEGQSPGEPDALADEPGAQALRVGQDGGRRVLPSTAVAAEFVGYAGVVWCITVPHGAFIARRNGLIFATGNSGFPKSLNLPGGLGTALKPAHEPIVVARKPLTSTVAANVVEFGTGALNIDACRVGTDAITQHGRNDGPNTSMSGRNYAEPSGRSWTGRWPANVVLDPDAAAVLDQQSGVQRDGTAVQRNGGGRRIGNTVYSGSNDGEAVPDAGYGGEGGASRFFYVAPNDDDAVHNEETTCTRTPIGEQLNGAPTAAAHPQSTTLKTPNSGSPTIEPPSTLGIDELDARFLYTAKADASERVRVEGVAHPTVKPLALMRWLVRLVTPPGGTVLEPFAGSGTTVEAAILEGFRCIAIEREQDYLPLILQRVHRRRDPVAAVRGAGGDGGLFDLLDVDPEGKSTEPRPAVTTRGRNQFGVINDDGWEPSQTGQRIEQHPAGRWPPNVVMDRAAADILDQQSGELAHNPPARWVSGTAGTDGAQTYGAGVGTAKPGDVRSGFDDKGGASRFFPVFDDEETA